ncbi:DUF4083 domain-containing protein [Psychrobacillus glaciei]|uniref:DUF4083 domain-containing protein n=1 Tax=Psychrobacillus glaciei TaxID=2283160 RepID=A0A5J6SPI9_9BACI|nr:DUF4083 family protein [Psychrobacillus glaciei]QFF99888.1 DUF4083 domain-containing protein [Psychrobacillus glaciei]
MEILFLTVIFSLILIGVLSFTLFIRRILINTSHRQNPQTSMNSYQQIEQKLDRIIELLEKKSADS